jgi:hypothetical protein
MPSLGSPQSNYKLQMDVTHWRATYTTDGVESAYKASDLGLPGDGDITCAWIEANDPGCAGAWVDELSADRKGAALANVLVAGATHQVSATEPRAV